ncbi:PREDICTED: ethylene-responsive transcription factor ERF017-like [Ipomoea nil]|uniref:ethylene-responsive transcription factor ERF017-like n=1 Tax=Ipomoea nil TaxID=35883 RepID=UPI0009014AD3|nr:PREDICTED: ethylene-responsive transcription factor ERF017-like [Ipomoea nil]
MVKPEKAIKNDNVSTSSPSSSSSSPCKYRGVRKRNWGKWVSEIRLPNSRERIWLGSFDSPEKAARAFDAALFCLRGKNANFNFPDNPPDIVDGNSMSLAQIKVAAANFANSEPPPRAAGAMEQQVSDPSTSLSSGAESPSPSVSDGAVHQAEGEMTETALDHGFLQRFSSLGGNANNAVTDFGYFPGFDDFSNDYYVPPMPIPDTDYVEETYDGSFLWNF